MSAGSRRRVTVANLSDGGFFYWLLKYYIFGLFVLVLAGLSTLPAIYVAIGATVPPPPDISAYQRKAELESYIYASDGRLLTTLADKHRYLVQIDRVPPLLVKAFLAAEDRKFFSHGGVDFKGILRAAWANMQAGVVRQGGSTITQQVAKAYLSPERTIQRKLKEVVLARRIEARFTKQEILYLYLNHIFFGAQAYGVKAAARIYFGKTLDRLTLGEMALMAGLVRAPSRYSPRASRDRAMRRRNQVLNAMLDSGFIDKPARDKARSETINLTPRSSDPLSRVAPHFTEHVRRLLLQRYGKERAYTSGWRVETTVDLPLHTLARKRTTIAVSALDKRQGWRGPLAHLRNGVHRRRFRDRVKQLYQVHRLEFDHPYPMLIEKVTPSRARGWIGDRPVEIPLSLMSWAAPYSRTNTENERTISSIRHALQPGDVVWVTSPVRWMRRKAWGSPGEKRSFMALDQIPRVEGALLTYDHQSGYVLAAVGGLDYDRSTFNRCTQACRQPGSTYKPIYYALALDGSDYSMATILQDRPYEPEPGEEWNPENVHGTLDGKVTMHMALVRSLNLPSIQLLVKVGAKETARWARRLGFTTPIHADKALALGASCVRMDELTRAFATFARGGSQRDPVYIRRILDRHGHAMEDHSVPEDPLLDEADRIDRAWARSTLRPRQVIDKRTAFLITKLLRDSVRVGIAARCQIVPAPTGGKGGTSSDTMDVWLVGFTSQWATTAWIGDDTYRRPLGEKEASYTSAIPMWANFMKAAVADRPHQDLPLTRPDGLKSAVIDFITGAPANAETKKSVRIYYRPGTYHPPKPSDG
jgi:penicillin-binding protein 1A